MNEPPFDSAPSTPPADAAATTTEADSSSPPTELATVPPMSPDARADQIIRRHVMWSMGAGLVPVPLADLAGVTAVQMDALKQLAELHGVPYSEDTGKRFVAALAGGVAARMGASLIKTLPGVGSVIGGVSMAALSGASTYALCQVADRHFRTHGTFLEVNWDEAKEAYQVALEKGREVVKSLQPKKRDAETPGGLTAEAEPVDEPAAASEAPNSESLDSNPENYPSGQV